MKKRLILLGLAAASSVLSAYDLSGEIFFDSRYNLNQENQDGTNADSYRKDPDSMAVSLFWADMCGKMGEALPGWEYHLRVQTPHYENIQMGLDPSITAYTYDYLLAMSLNSVNDEDIDFLSFYSEARPPWAESVPVNSSFEAKISRAYLSYDFSDKIHVDFGLIGLPEITSDKIYHRPYIGQYPNNQVIGTVVEHAGNHAGVSVDGSFGAFGYTAAVWHQTLNKKFSSLPQVVDDISLFSVSPTGYGGDFSGELSANVSAANFDSKSLNFGFGGRFSLAPQPYHGWSWGIGVGYNNAPLNMPILLATIGKFAEMGEGPDESVTSYSAVTYDRLSNAAVDLSVSYDKLFAHIGYQIQTAHKDLYDRYDGTHFSEGSYQPIAAVPAEVDLFYQDGNASGFWLELGYLLKGDGYQFDRHRAVISGVKLSEKQCGLELTARYGTQVRSNILALLSREGWVDYNIANVDGNQMFSTNHTSISIEDVDNEGTTKFLMIVTDNTDYTGQAILEDYNLPHQLADGTNDVFKEKQTAFSFGINYYVNANVALKAEFEQRSNQYKKITTPSDWTDSWFAKNVQTFRLRGDYSF